MWSPRLWRCRGKCELNGQKMGFARFNVRKRASTMALNGVCYYTGWTSGRKNKYCIILVSCCIFFKVSKSHYLAFNKSHEKLRAGKEDFVLSSTCPFGIDWSWPWHDFSQIWIFWKRHHLWLQLYVRTYLNFF